MLLFEKWKKNVLNYINLQKYLYLFNKREMQSNPTCTRKSSHTRSVLNSSFHRFRDDRAPLQSQLRSRPKQQQMHWLPSVWRLFGRRPKKTFLLVANIEFLWSLVDVPLSYYTLSIAILYSCLNGAKKYKYINMMWLNFILNF